MNRLCAEQLPKSRRSFVCLTAGTIVTACTGIGHALRAEPDADRKTGGTVKQVNAGVLEIGYLESGPADGSPVVLLHGFPYDVRTYDLVARSLSAAGRRVIVPYLRGFGPTHFLHRGTPRVGQQAALGSDLLSLLDALSIQRATVAGYDWGGRAACVVAALWPDRVNGLLSCGTGYNLQTPAKR